MWIRGSDLSPALRRAALRRYCMRLTQENGNRVRATLPREQWPTDAEWVNGHAFAIVRDGSRFDERVRHCVPHYLADR